MKELSHFHTVVVDHKTQMQLQKVEYQNNMIYRDLDHKINFFRDDVKKIQELEDNKNNKIKENDFLKKLEDFKIKTLNFYENFPHEISKASIINKITSYCTKMRINSKSFVESLNNVYTQNDELDLQTVKKNLVKFNVLSDSEAEFFVGTLLTYKNDNMKKEHFICLIDNQFKEAKIKENVLNVNYNSNSEYYDLNKDKEDELLELYDDDDDYEYFIYILFFYIFFTKIILIRKFI